MCFPSQDASSGVTPAPTSLANTYQSVTQTSAPVNPPGSTTDNSLGPQAVARDAQDKPTAPVTGYSVTSGLAGM